MRRMAHKLKKMGVALWLDRATGTKSSSLICLCMYDSMSPDFVFATNKLFVNHATVAVFHINSEVKTY